MRGKLKTMSFIRYGCFVLVGFAVMACRGNDGNGFLPDDGLEHDSISSPEVPVVTGQLVSIDGSGTHIYYDYDDQGRVVRAEYHDTLDNQRVEKQVMDYRYDSDRIYVMYELLMELADGKRDEKYNQWHVRDDTLFLKNGLVDSIAGAQREQYNILPSHFCCHYQYDEHGELVASHTDNVYIPVNKNPGNISSWFTQDVNCAWKDGDMQCQTFALWERYSPVKTVTYQYKYSSVLGFLPNCSPDGVLLAYEPLYSMGYFGVVSGSLPTEITISYWSEEVDVESYSYSLDTNNRVRTIGKTLSKNGQVTGEYHYQVVWK